MSNVAQLQDYWNSKYESTTTPFDVEEPDEWIAALAMSGQIYGHVLDSGCGPGRTSLYLADQGYRVLGVDFSINAIERAKRKAVESGSSARFLQANICKLSGYDDHFDTVVDIGCFHSLHEDDRGRYAAALHWACRTGAVVYLRAFSENDPNSWIAPTGLHSPAVSEEHIRTAFSSNGWIVKDLSERQIELFISREEMPKKYCWFAEIQRT